MQGTFQSHGCVSWTSRRGGGRGGALGEALKVMGDPGGGAEEQRQAQRKLHPPPDARQKALENGRPPCASLGVSRPAGDQGPSISGSVWGCPSEYGPEVSKLTTCMRLKTGVRRSWDP